MLKEMQFDNITVKVFQDAVELGRAAAQETSQYLKGLGKAPINLLFSTGASQFTFMDGLKEQEIAWDRIHAYHLDEYKNISPEHPASFRLWIRQRIEEALRPQKVEYIHGDAPSAQEECERYTRLLENNPIDLGFIVLGENGHIAFNDPQWPISKTRFWLKWSNWMKRADVSNWVKVGCNLGGCTKEALL